MISSDINSKTNTKSSHLTNTNILEEVSVCGFAVYNILGTLINSYYARIDTIRLLIDCLRIAIFFVFALDVLDKMMRKRVKLSNAFYIFAICSVLVFLKSKRYNLIFMIIFATWAGSFDFKRILKIGIRFRFVGIFIVIASALCGIIQNDIVMRMGSDTIRFSLGFIAPSLCLAYILNIIIAEIVVSNLKLEWRKVIFYAVLVLILYFITDARLDALICLFMLLCAVLAKILKGNSVKFFGNKFLNAILLLVPLIAFLLNTLLLYGFKAEIPLFVKLASYLSRRVEYTLEAYELAGVNLFGSDLNWQKYDIILDSSYFKLLLEYGIVSLLLIIYGYCVIIKKTVINKNFPLLFSIVLILGEAIFEPFLFDYNYNFLILLFGSIFIKNLKQPGGKSVFEKSCSGSSNV